MAQFVGCSPFSAVAFRCKFGCSLNLRFITCNFIVLNRFSEPFHPEIPRHGHPIPCLVGLAGALCTRVLMRDQPRPCRDARFSDDYLEISQELHN